MTEEVKKLKNEKVKKFTIETDGTCEGTKIKINGEVVEAIQRIEFSADANDIYPKVLLEKALLDGSGKPKMRTVNLRNLQTEKFEESKAVITEPYPLEFKKTVPAIKTK